MYCSPAHFSHGLHHKTCFKKDQLELIANIINSKEQKQVIPVTTLKKTHAKIKEHFKNECGDKEYCWLEHLDYDARRVLYDVFRPKRPLEWSNNPRTWLNNNDIKVVMKQYEKLHKDFEFLGVFSIDFSQYHGSTCISNLMDNFNMCTFDIKQIKAKKHKRFAFVLNLDTINEPGSHWVALYCNLNPKLANFGIYYYDSVTSPAHQDVKKFMNLVKSQVLRDHPRLGKRFELEFNKVQRQFKNTECGMFCITYLTQCVKNIPFKEICARMKKDDDINKIRNIVYTPPSK